MKILGGMFRGRNFFMPADIRPTQDVVRKAIFDTIGQHLEGFTFLDLFAGSGALGLEAVSRQAKRVLFVEKDPLCVRTISESLVALDAKYQDYSAYSFFVMNADAFAAVKDLHNRREKFDIIFADPPFDVELAKKILKLLSAYDIVHPNSLLIIQHGKREILPEVEGRFSRVREKKYGVSYVSIYQSEE